MSEKLYAERDCEELGEDYMRHLSAMTTEKLHSKGDIAAELAWRDREIRRLRTALEHYANMPIDRPDLDRWCEVHEHDSGIARDALRGAE